MIFHNVCGSNLQKYLLLIQDIQKCPANCSNSDPCNKRRPLLRKKVRKSAKEKFGGKFKIDNFQSHVDGYRIHANNNKKESPFCIMPDINKEVKNGEKKQT